MTELSSFQIFSRLFCFVAIQVLSHANSMKPSSTLGCISSEAFRGLNLREYMTWGHRNRPGEATLGWQAAGTMDTTKVTDRDSAIRYEWAWRSDAANTVVGWQE